MILSEVNQREDGYIDVYFFESQSIKQFRKSFILEKCLDLSIMKLSDILTLDLISMIFDTKTESKGEKYVSDSRIRIETINDYRIEAKVIGTHAYTVKIRSDEGFLHFSCTCPVDEEECKHVYALMKYIVCKYEGKEVEEITPFQDIFNRLYIAEGNDYFDLGFEACVLFLEKPETSSKVIINNLQGFDYYSNRVFVPFVINEDVYNELLNNCSGEYRNRLIKIRQRYSKAIGGRNYSTEDIIISFIFAKQYEAIFKRDISNIYLSEIARSGIIYAAHHVDITPEIARYLVKLSLSEKEVVSLFNYSQNKGAKKTFFMVYPRYFSFLSPEEINDLEYTPEDIFESFKDSPSTLLPEIIISNSKIFIKHGKEEYLPGMIMDAFNHEINIRRSFLELYNVIESLPDNSLLLKIDFKGDRKTASQILNRWRGYEGR